VRADSLTGTMKNLACLLGWINGLSTCRNRIRPRERLAYLLKALRTNPSSGNRKVTGS
jgi:hypothetical protein